ncbi:dihydroxyacetone kinase subunit DhaK [Anaerostipes butyraticus]|mgnify:FL=1|uniref:Dihydroxyacetone kinase subunit DhaK n=1 Tax=Anaerostipes butyraticus TaxID=645466 RepID=A0A916Q7A5_9FIRM|nr:dihydroxyacetone kinase subunit DhaK [Anaerostipes butyraticus]GFO85729.1 dihydroxyacetone kinase subunit DhaK [Anaerostipes butyraticus]HJC82744.1 dihydroxyacetone kinase subunit DhaK [Candidatus Anaerostipes avicola]
MQRFVNDPDYIVDDMVKGFVKAHEDLIVKSEKNDRVVKYKNAPVEGKVGLVTGGGSGHEPAFLGYVGENMMDAAAVGEIFSSPSAQTFYDAFLEADAGKGVACLFGNYAGDNMNVKMAIRKAGKKGVEVKMVAATDDISSSPKETKEKRHGIAGGVFMWKIGGARAALGGSLDEVIQSAQKAVDATRSICVGLEPCTIPAVGHPNFNIENGKMEFGIGHHGEPGMNVQELKSADEIADQMTEAVCEDLELARGDETAVILSGLGATPVMEQYVLYGRAEKYLERKGIHVYRAFVGNYVTSLDMNGAALTIMRLDDELKELLDYEAGCPGLTVKAK